MVLKYSSKDSSAQAGFTVFEVIIVVVGLAILAAIIPWVYSSTPQTPAYILPAVVRDQKVKVSLLKNDLANAILQLEAFKNSNNFYPATNDCLKATSQTNICLVPNQGSVFDYHPGSAQTPKSFTLYAGKTGVTHRYKVTNTQTTPVLSVANN